VTATLDHAQRIHFRDRFREARAIALTTRSYTPRNLAALIASEAGELLALFRWGQDSLADRPGRVREELADVLLGVLRFADVAGIDLESAAREKIATNVRNYPADGEGVIDNDDDAS